jgi:hypothetical protein
LLPGFYYDPAAARPTDAVRLRGLYYDPRATFLPGIYSDPAALHAATDPIGLRGLYYDPRASLLPGLYSNPAATDPVGLHGLYSDPAAVHAATDPVGLRGLYYDPRASLLPGLYTDPAAAAAAFHAARPTGPVGLPALYYDPRALSTASYTATSTPHPATSSSPSTDLGAVLGMRVSEALRLGDPAPPSTTVALQPSRWSWVLGASTGDYTSPSGFVYKPGMMRPETCSIPALTASHTPRGETSSSSWRQTDARFTSPQSAYVSGASSQLNPAATQALHSAATYSRLPLPWPREETRAKVLQDDPIKVAAQLMMREFAGHVVLLLEEGAEDETRVRLLTILNLQIHRLMENPNGSNVFGALLRSCKDHPDDLHGVVQAFIQRNDAAWRRWIVRRAEDSDDFWYACHSTSLVLLLQLW